MICQVCHYHSGPLTRSQRFCPCGHLPVPAPPPGRLAVQHACPGCDALFWSPDPPGSDWRCRHCTETQVNADDERGAHQYEMGN